VHREHPVITSQVFVPRVFSVYHARSFLLPVSWRDPISGVPALVQGKKLSLSPRFYAIVSVHEERSLQP